MQTINIYFNYYASSSLLANQKDRHHSFLTYLTELHNFALST